MSGRVPYSQASGRTSLLGLDASWAVVALIFVLRPGVLMFLCLLGYIIFLAVVQYILKCPLRLLGDRVRASISSSVKYPS